MPTTASNAFDADILRATALVDLAQGLPDVSDAQRLISANIHRRHLDESQRANIAAKLANIGHGTVGGGHDRQSGKSADLVSQEEAAKLLNVSERLVRDAKAIQKASPERSARIDAGEITVSRAKKEMKAGAKRKALTEAQETIGLEARKSIASVCSCAEKHLRSLAYIQGSEQLLLNLDSFDIEIIEMNQTERLLSLATDIADSVGKTLDEFVSVTDAELQEIVGETFLLVDATILTALRDVARKSLAAKNGGEKS